MSSSQNNIKISMEDKMQNKESNIRLLLLGRAVSLFGSTVYLIVLPLYIVNYLCKCPINTLVSKEC